MSIQNVTFPKNRAYYVSKNQKQSEKSSDTVLNGQAFDETPKKNSNRLLYTGIGAVLLIITAYFNRERLAKLFNGKNNVSAKPSTTSSASRNKPSVNRTKTTRSKKNSNGIIEQYEHISKKIVDFWEANEGIEHLPAEIKAEETLLYRTLTEITEKAGKKNLSLIPIKTEADFPQSLEARNLAISEYLQNIVFNRVQYSVKSALDGIDMFEKFGQKEIAQNSGIIYNFALQIGTLAKKYPHESVLVRFLQFIEHLGQQGLKSDESTAVSMLIRRFTDNNQNISKETILTGIRMVKDISTHKKGAVQLYNSLKRSEYSNNSEITDALSELFETVKNMEM